MGNDSEENTGPIDNKVARDGWLKFEIIAKSMSLILIPLILGILTFQTDFFKTSREFETKMLELSLSVLRTDPKTTDQPGIREWAIELLEEHSGIKLKEQAKREFGSGPIQTIDATGVGACLISRRAKSNLCQISSAAACSFINEKILEDKEGFASYFGDGSTCFSMEENFLEQ